jgi:hypothetical protein
MKKQLFFLLIFCLISACGKPVYTNFKLSEKRFVLCDSVDVSETFKDSENPVFIPVKDMRAREGTFYALESGSYLLYAFDTLGTKVHQGNDIFPYHLKTAGASNAVFDSGFCFFYSNKYKQLYTISYEGKTDSVALQGAKTYCKLLAYNALHKKFIGYNYTFLPVKVKKGKKDLESPRFKEKKILCVFFEDGRTKTLSRYPKHLNKHKITEEDYCAATENDKIYVKRIDNDLIEVYDIRGRKNYAFGAKTSAHYLTKNDVKKISKRVDYFANAHFFKEKGKNNFVICYLSTEKEQFDAIKLVWQNFDEKEYAEITVRDSYILPYTQNGKIYTFQPLNPQKIYVYELR